MQLAVAPEQEGSASFRVASSTADRAEDRTNWRSHAAGVIALKSSQTGDRAAAPPVDLAAIQARCGASFAPAELRDAVRERGIDLGPAFETLRQVATGASEAIGFAELSDEMAADMPGYGVHPALLDAALQVASAALVRDPLLGNPDDTYMPVAIERFRLFAPIGRQLWSHVVIRKLEKSTTPIADLTIYDADGALAAEIIGLRLKRVENAAWATRATDAIGDELYRVQWERVDAPAAMVQGSVARGTWILFSDATGVATELAAELERTGDRVVMVQPANAFVATNAGVGIPIDDPGAFSRLIEEVAAVGQPIAGLVHGWSLDAPPPDDASVAELHAAQTLGVRSALHLVQAAATSSAAASSRVVLLTRGTQAIVGGDVGNDVGAPIHATMWGLGATVRLEHPDLQCLTVDLDPAGPCSIGELAARLRSSGEQQLAIRNHEWFAPRLARVEREPVDASTADGNASVKLVNTTPGVLDGLTFVDDPRRAPGPHEVEIAVEISALNFRDVLVAMALYPGASAADHIGGECAGTVVAVGEAVSRFAVGDAVIAMAPGALGSYAVTHEELVLPVPPGFTTEQAVTLPTVFLTTWHSLYDLAQLKAGERVLIHAGAGGIGLSAIQLAKRAGAEIFATAGSPAKRAFLESLGVHHVMDSRSLAYADQIMEVTGGAGVDVVLNSLTDDHIPRSFGLLSEGGRFVELGKRGIWTEERARTAHPGVRYFVVDLLATSHEQPETIGTVMRAVYAAAVGGEIAPLPSTTFASTNVSAAFRYMAQARHIGKILVTRKRTTSGVSIRPDATYLVTGGLGGLGLVTADWLVERGAGHVVVMGRRAPDDASRATIDRMNSHGPRVSVFLGDVGTEQGVRGALGVIASQHPPLRGIVHAAGVLNDGVIVGKAWDAFAATLGPKVDGTWHLHRHTQDLSLDFFVLYSSISALFGSPGQANHAAANAFLDAFAHYRRARGLPATSINWGAWRDVGVAVTHDVATRIGAQGMGTISPAEGMEALERLLDGGSVQAAVMPVDWSRFATQFGGGHLRSTLMVDLANASPGAGHRAKGSSPTVSPSVEDLRKAPVATRWTSLLQRMKQITAQVLGLEPSQPVDEYRPLQELGLDSLMAVELRNLMKAAFALERPVPATVVFDYPNVHALTEFIGTGVYGWNLPGAESAASPVADERGSGDMDMLDRLATLSADEVEALLAQRMSDGA
jgi:NADPH:quinone reductase-like Zn-dependent oxidoreductase/acyl carrier protein